MTSPARLRTNSRARSGLGGVLDRQPAFARDAAGIEQLDSRGARLEVSHDLERVCVRRVADDENRVALLQVSCPPSDWYSAASCSYCVLSACSACSYCRIASLVCWSIASMD